MDLIPLTAHTYHEMDGNSICESVYLGVVPAQPPGPGILGHLLRRMCLPQGPDLAVGFTPASRWGGGGGCGSRASLPSEEAPYVGSGERCLVDQPPSGKGDNVPGIARRETERETQHQNKWL